MTWLGLYNIVERVALLSGHFVVMLPPSFSIFKRRPVVNEGCLDIGM